MFYVCLRSYKLATSLWIFDFVWHYRRKCPWEDWSNGLSFYLFFLFILFLYKNWDNL